jgi:hypothetical protein
MEEIMSKKTRRKTLQPAPVAPPPMTVSSSAKSVWRRSGLLIAGGLFLLSNLALRLVDTKTLEQTALPMIVFLTFLSIALAIGFGLQQLIVSRRAQSEGWSKTDWEQWRNGFEPEELTVDAPSRTVSSTKEK